MWGILGDIVFDALSSPGGMTHNTTSDYAQHALIGRKARLEAINHGLDEISLDISLHYQLGSVENRINEFLAAKMAQQPLALILGNGDYKGNFVITSFGIASHKTASDGTLISATLNVSLLEYVGQITEKLETPGILDNGIKASAIKILSGIESTTQSIAGLARTAENTVQQVSNLIGEARSLAQNPLSVLSLVPNIKSAVNAARDVAVKLYDAASLVSSTVSDVASIAQMGTGIAQDMTSINNILSNCRTDNIATALQSVEKLVNKSVSRITDLRPVVMNLTANITMRKI